MFDELDQAIAQASALTISERRALLLKLTSELLEGNCGAAERERLSEIICRIGATMDLQDGSGINPVSEDQLLSFLRAGQREAFLVYFSAIAGIAKSDAAKLLNGDAAETLAMLCKKIGIPRETYSAIIVLCDPNRPVEKTEMLLELYDRASPRPHVTHQAA